MRASGAAACKNTSVMSPGLYGLRKRGNKIQHISLKRVIHPLSVSAGADETGMLEHFQMKGEEWLRDIKHLLQFADAAFLVRQHLDDGHSCDIRQGMKPQRHVRQLARQRMRAGRDPLGGAG